MTYLITQTFLLLLVAALLGLVLGWYLTRISAASARAMLQARLQSAESDARELRGELDAAVNARGACEAERKGLAEQLAALQAEKTGDDAGAAAARIAELEAELAAYRDARDERGIEPAATVAAIADAAAPPAWDTADDQAPDDLQQIKGIGPKIAGILHELGIRRFEQIAAWTPENAAWVNDHLQFKGRIEREDWIAQARALAARRGAD